MRTVPTSAEPVIVALVGTSHGEKPNVSVHKPLQQVTVAGNGLAFIDSEVIFFPGHHTPTDECR